MPAAIVDASAPDAATGWDKDDWCTPPNVLALVRDLAGGKIGLDPCWNEWSLTDPTWRMEAGALEASWRGMGLAFVNPPYSRGNLARFAIKIAEEALEGVEVVALVPANVETSPWQDVFWGADAVCFPRGRVRFLVDGKPRGTPLFGSALVYFGSRPLEFEKVFANLGAIVFPRGP